MIRGDKSGVLRKFGGYSYPATAGCATGRWTSIEARRLLKQNLHVSVSVEHSDHLQRPGIRAVNHDEVGKAGYRPKPDRQRRNFASFGAHHGALGKAVTRRQNRRLNAIRRIYIVGCNVSPYFVKIVERAWSELKRGAHLSGNAPFCPAGLEDLNGLRGIHKLASFSLREALFDLSGKSIFVRQYPILIPMLILNDGKGLIEHLFRAHAGTNSLIEHLLLLGFELDEHDTPLCG
jgi:hypothetical protein